MTQQLTEKSDVFSFGIVLLEIICGRQPINTALQDRNQWNIGEWVSRFFIFLRITNIFSEGLHIWKFQHVILVLLSL
jgi:serine/threonine protein kinase